MNKYQFEDIMNFTTARRRALRKVVYDRLAQYGDGSYHGYLCVLDVIGIRLGFEINKYRLDERSYQKAVKYLDMILPPKKAQAADQAIKYMEAHND